jgi:hypothetical protein
MVSGIGKVQVEIDDNQDEHDGCCQEEVDKNTSEIILIEFSESEFHSWLPGTNIRGQNFNED